MNTVIETVIAINSQNVLEVRHFADVKQARSIGNGFLIVRNAAELNDASVVVSTAALVDLYNKYADKPVKRFSDRSTASQRVWDTITAKIEVEKGLNMTQVNEAVKNAAATAGTDKAAAAEAKKAEAARKAEVKAAEKKAKEDKKAADKKAKADAKAAKDAAKAAGGGDKTRKSIFAGKVLKHKIAKDAEGNIKNPRRPGSHGWNSLKIIIDAGDKGITLDAYQKAGGRMNDLHWDVDHGNAEAVDAPKAEENQTA